MTSYLQQLTDLTQSISHSAHHQAQKLERFSAELAFAGKFSATHPGQAAEWQALIVEAGRAVQAGLHAPNANLDDLIAQGEAILSPIGRAAKEHTLLCVSHAHIDMNWMWSWPETVAVTNDTFQTMLALLNEFPGFIFSQSQASTYHLIEQYNPAMFEEIRRCVREGRWEVTASQWVEGDKNMSSGESLSRHLLYTRAYFQDRFGLSPEDVQVDFEPDTFGHPATLPTILARGGVKYYYHCRGSHGPHLYWWIGPDGSRILAFNDIKWYMCAVGPQIADALPEFAQTTGMKAMPVLYGVGDHGGGPTRRDLKRIDELNTWPIYPNVTFSTLHNFFRRAEKEATGVPEIAGERNFVFTGCYTTQARQKWANRHGESILYAAEAAAVLGEQLAGVAYPQENLEAAWKGVLFSQFHDILPGSGIRETRHYTMGRAQETQAAASMARTNALRALSEQVNTAALRRAFADAEARANKDEVEAALAQGAGVGHAAGTGGESAYSAAQGSDRAFLIFNPLPYPRSAVIEAKLWDTELDEKSLVATSEGANPWPVQVLNKGNYWGHKFTTMAFPVQAPALGYRAVCISDRLAELGLPGPASGDPWAGMGGSWRKIVPTDFVLENEFIRAEIDPASGSLVSLFDKRSGREWVPESDPAGMFQYSIEGNLGMSAWVIGPFVTQEDLMDGGELKKVSSGPYVNTFRWTRKIHNSMLELDITVRQGMPRVEFRLRVDWREMGDAQRGIPNLRVRFPLAVQNAQPRYEAPFGAVRRDLFDGEEIVAQRWADLSEANGAGVTLVNSSKYGFSLEGNVLSMTLLRASIEPDPLPDIGEHIIEYALAPHGDGWTVGDATGAGEEMNVPLVATSCGFHDGSLPPTASFVAVENGNVRLAALKKAENGQGFVLRLYEVAGRETEARVQIAPELLSDGMAAVEVDTLERPLAANRARLEGNMLTVPAPAYGISTVMVTQQRKQ